MLDSTIPPRLRDTIQREVESDERIVWSSQPRPTYFNPISTGMFLFAIPWTAFSLFWIAGASQAIFQAEEVGILEIAFPMFGLPFVFIGLGMLSAPYWSYRAALNTAYVITDRRAITFDGLRSITIRSYQPYKLQDLFRRENSDGSGDLIISRNAWRDSDGDRHTLELGFLRIENAKEVEQKLRALADRAPER